MIQKEIHDGATKVERFKLTKENMKYFCILVKLDSMKLKKSVVYILITTLIEECKRR